MYGRTTLLAASLLCVISGKVHASGSVDCFNESETIFVGIGLSRAPIFESLNAYVEHSDTVWSTNPDYMDTNHVDIVFSLKVSLAETVDNFYKGTVTFADGIVHPVSCTFG